MSARHMQMDIEECDGVFTQTCSCKAYVICFYALFLGQPILQRQYSVSEKSILHRIEPGWLLGTAQIEIFIHVVCAEYHRINAQYGFRLLVRTHV